MRTNLYTENQSATIESRTPIVYGALGVITNSVIQNLLYEEDGISVSYLIGCPLSL